jgi:isocitrate dehydrogenase (NAD+)
MYASLSLCKNVPGVESRLSNVDIAIIRENTEGEYSGLEHQVSYIIVFAFNFTDNL